MPLKLFLTLKKIVSYYLNSYIRVLVSDKDDII